MEMMPGGGGRGVLGGGVRAEGMALISPPALLQHCREETWQRKVQELPLAAVTDPLWLSSLIITLSAQEHTG